MNIGKQSTFKMLKTYGERTPETHLLLAKELSSRWDYLHKILLEWIRKIGTGHPQYEFAGNLVYHDGNMYWVQVNLWIKLYGYGDEKNWVDNMWSSCLKLHDFIRIAEYICEKENLIQE
jgi:hypothetical protein